MTRKLLAVVLALVLCVALVPVHAETTSEPLTYMMHYYSTPDDEILNAEWLGDNWFITKWKEATGIDFTYDIWGVSAAEQFSLTMAGKDLPDIIEYDWTTYPGGVDKALSDGRIIALNDYLDEYAPNLKRFLDENPDIALSLQSSDGSYYCFPFIRSPQAVCYGGPIIRKDLLDQWGLAVPVTIDDWTNVLARAKAEGVAAPLTFEYSTNDFLNLTAAFSSAFDVRPDYYLDDGKIMYGQATEQYKEYLRKLAEWYQAGYIDVDFAAIDSDTVKSKMLDGTAIATVGWAGSRLSSYMNDATIEGYEVVGAPVPTLEAGQVPEFGHMERRYSGQCCAAISASCKDIPAACKLLDYLYSPEGQLHVNFGIEGITYVLDENGNPQFTEQVLNARELYGISPNEFLTPFCRGTNGPNWQMDGNTVEELQQKADALAVWTQTNQAAHMIPAMTQTDEESALISRYSEDINSYADSMEVLFIMGDADLDAEWDSFVETLYAMGLQEVLDAKNAAYQRYVNR